MKWVSGSTLLVLTRKVPKGVFQLEAAEMYLSTRKKEKYNEG